MTTFLLLLLRVLQSEHLPLPPAGVESLAVENSPLCFSFLSFFSSACSFTRQPLLLVSLDGLRPDYLSSPDSAVPVLRKLSESQWRGTVARGTAHKPATFPFREDQKVSGGF